MSQTAFTIRLDSDDKKILDELCNDFGMSTNTLFNIFAKKVVKERCIPFVIGEPKKAVDGYRSIKNTRREAMLNHLPDMTFEEINEEIRQYRQGL